jgi:membrane-associated phospholipid phosphatase
MPLPQRFHIILCVLLFQLGPLTAGSQNIDIDLLKSVNPENPSSYYWKSISRTHIWVSSTATLGSLAYGLLKKDKNIQHNAYETLIAIGINVAATGGIKTVFNRTRPVEDYPNDIYVLSLSNGHSFPSGHTSLAFATATSFAIQYKKWYVVVPAYLWAGSMGYSRLYLGKHYPSDVLGGAIVGVTSSLLSHWLNQKLFKPKPAMQ